MSRNSASTATFVIKYEVVSLLATNLTKQLNK